MPVDILQSNLFVGNTSKCNLHIKQCVSFDTAIKEKENFTVGVKIRLDLSASIKTKKPFNLEL